MKTPEKEIWVALSPGVMSVKEETIDSALRENVVT